MNVLMILSNPFIVDPRVYNEAKTLIDRGYKVTVIVWDRHNDYEDEDTIDGIRVVRIHNSGLMRILPHALFKNPIWWRHAYKKALDLYNKNYKFDVVHCHDLDTLKTGIWLKKKLGIKLVYDAHEIFGYMIARNMPKIISNYALSMEKKLVKYVDQIITVNEPLYDYFKSISDKPANIIMNCKKIFSNEYQPIKNKVFTISYIGVLHKSRMFPELVDIIGNIENVKFVIAGKKENLYEEVKKQSLKYNNVEFLGSIPFDQVIPKTFESDIVICMINPNDKNNGIAVANKQFEAMVCGRPIICTKNTYSGDLTEKLECGLVVDFNGDSVKEAIITLKNNKELCEKYGKNALKAATEKYNWESQSNNLIKIYEKLGGIY